MSELPLLEGVLNYIRGNNISFCMPGHKNGKGFYSTPIGRKFVEKILQFDITEVEGVDNLHDQNGIILEASEKLSDFYGSQKSYFLINGSTSGNIIMIFSSLNEGDKVIVERNCHKSILNALIMRKLIPVYIENILSKKLNAPSAINLEHFLQVINSNRDAKAIIVTYPNYYGICSNLDIIIKTARKYNMKVLVDSAHGAHFGVCPDLPESAVKLGADMVVMSSHKTLSSLTQTAYLHVNNKEELNKTDFYFDMFLSTSPSYIFLCSMDYARFYLERYGAESYKSLISLANSYRKKIDSITGMTVVNKDFMENAYSEWNMDLTRFIVHLDKGYSGKLLSKYLRANKIQVEMCDLSNVVFILSPFDNESEFENLYNILKNCRLEDLKYNTINIRDYGIPKIIMSPYEAISREKQNINLNCSKGRICGKAVIPYPPGIPIICPGELIDNEVIESIKYYKISKSELIGFHENNIEVIK